MKKSILLLTILVLAFAMLSFSVNAISCGFVNPASNGQIRNNANMTVTIASGGISETDIAVYINASSATSLNSTNSLLDNASNNTGTGMIDLINITFGNSIILRDANDYTFRCACQNSTETVACNSTSTGVLVDRTVPSAATAVTFSNPVESGETITATITRTNTNSCFIRFGSPNAPRLTMTLSGSTCTFTPTSNNPSDSAYQAYVEASDSLNTTQTTSQNIEIDIVKSDGGGLFGAGAQIQVPANQGLQGALGGSTNPFAPQGKLQQGLNNIFSNPIAVIIIIILVVIIFNKKK